MSNTRNRIYIAIASILFCVNFFTFYYWHKAIPSIKASIEQYSETKLKNQNKQNTINSIFSGDTIGKEDLIHRKSDLIPTPDSNAESKLIAMIPGYKNAKDKSAAINKFFCPSEECSKAELMDFYGVPDSTIEYVIADLTALDSLILILLLTFSTSYFLNLGWLGINCLKELISGGYIPKQSSDSAP